jgi:hypothetical protein
MQRARIRTMSSLLKQPSSPIVLSALALSLNSCRIVGGIFKAGVWVGVIAVALVVGLLFGLVRMLGGSR